MLFWRRWTTKQLLIHSVPYYQSQCGPATVWLPTLFKISSYWCECLWCCTVYGGARTTADRMCAVAWYNGISSKADRGEIFIRAAADQMGALSRMLLKKKWMWHDIRRPILGIRALHLTHPKCTHTAVHTHPEHWEAIYAAAPKQLGVRCLAQVHFAMVLKVEGALYIHSLHSLHWQSLPARDSNSQPFDYESNSLTIRPRLPPNHNEKAFSVTMFGFEIKIRDTFCV